MSAHLRLVYFILQRLVDGAFDYTICAFPAACILTYRNTAIRDFVPSFIFWCCYASLHHDKDLSFQTPMGSCGFDKETRRGSPRNSKTRPSHRHE